MAGAITINLILSAVAFTAIVGSLLAATRPPRRTTLPPTSRRTTSVHRSPRESQPHPAGALA